ncbi:sensor domain-containing phosphodiesterase [Alteromonas gilva]|uniref:EAL domain-containing protein n=1 Tax=Alteromonas gilva TaxID=2987522 RepID=A0ABT5L5S6_9ALTE|nr:EAL domain-containing protein [Alteromonas gilva]MDC8832413.1 EAL domain-containing protein [Alteromonas gilva]
MTKLKKFSGFVGQARGQEYFELVVLALSEIIDCDYVLIGRPNESIGTCSTVAMAAFNRLEENFTYPLKGSPCHVVTQSGACRYDCNVAKLYPDDTTLTELNIEAYIAMPLYDAHGQINGLLVAMNTIPLSSGEEISALFEMIGYRIAAELERMDQDRSLNMLSSIFKHSAEAMLVTDSERNIIEVNQAFCDMFGYSKKQVIGLNPQIVSSGVQDQAFFRDFWHKLFKTGVWQGEIKNRHADGSILEQWVSVSQIRDGNGHIHHYTAIYTDLTEFNQTQAENLYLANTDPLSRLSSKSFLVEMLKSPGRKSLLMIGIDGLRYLNDAYGFDLCDELIRQTAAIIKSLIVADCYVGAGPGKFALLFNSTTDLNAVAEQVGQYFRHQQVVTGDVRVFVSLSFGGARGRSDLLRLAGAALRQSRDSGDLTCVILDEETQSQQSNHRLLFVEANNIVHNAINQQLVVPYFQGIHDNHSGTITHYEALARIHYNDQVLSPYSFIEAAQVAGVLPLLTRQIIQQAFKAMSQYDYSFSLNITEYDLNAQYLQRFLMAQCDAYQIAPQRVILEVLEGISSSGKQNHLKQLKMLKRCGFKLAIDDFGTEYSNFERILDIEADYLKIDAKYIKRIDTDKKSYEIVKALSFFCQNSGIKCVAEYVHSLAVQQCLLELGIDYSQGFLFSKPAPFGEKSMQGTMAFRIDDDLPVIVHFTLNGHIPKEMRFTKAFRNFIATMAQPVRLGLFDFRHCDYFQMGEADLIDRANLASIEPLYQQFRKVAVLIDGQYAEKMAAIWCQHIDAIFEVRCFHSTAAAKRWLYQPLLLNQPSLSMIPELSNGIGLSC